MATYGKKLLDLSGNIILPKTRSSLVYMDDNTTVEDAIQNILSSKTKALYAKGYYVSANSYGGYSSLLEAVLAHTENGSITFFNAQTADVWKDAPRLLNFEYCYTVMAQSGRTNATVFATCARDTVYGTEGAFYVRNILASQWNGNWQMVDINNIRNEYARKDGTSFTGNVVFYSSNRSGDCARNISVYNSAGSSFVSTNLIMFNRA